MWTQIRLLLQGRSDLDLRCLLKRIQNVSADAKTYTFIVRCALRVYLVWTFVLKCALVFET